MSLSLSLTPTGMVETIVEIFYEGVKVRKGLLTEVPAEAEEGEANKKQQQSTKAQGDGCNWCKQ